MYKLEHSSIAKPTFFYKQEFYAFVFLVQKIRAYINDMTNLFFDQLLSLQNFAKKMKIVKFL